MKPSKSLKIFKLFLTKSQLPYEMIFVLSKCQRMAIQELSEYYGKDASQIDAETMMPYLLYVVVRGVYEVNMEEIGNNKTLIMTKKESTTSKEGEEEQDNTEYDMECYTQDHLMRTAFKSRMLMIEYFTVKELSFDEGQYAFVSFKNVEEMIDKCEM